MKKISLLICGLLFFAGFLSLKSETKAQGTATISVSPASGSYQAGQTFQASVVVNGGGQEFTSFGASVSVSNLTVVSLSKGSVSQWTTEPSAGSLNFYGAIAGQTSNVTVYTMTLKSDAGGTGKVMISGGTVKQTDGYTITEILSGVSGAIYQIQETQTSQPPSTTNPTPTPVRSNKATPTPTPKVSGQPTVPTPTPSAAATPVPSEAPKPVAAPELPVEKAKLEKEWVKYEVNKDVVITLSAENVTIKSIADKKAISNILFKGTALPNSLVTIHIFSNKVTKSAMADAEGKWSIQVDDPLESGNHEAYALVTKDNETTRSSDKFTFQVDPEKKVVAQVVTAIEKTAFYKDFWFWSTIALLVLIAVGFIIIKRKRVQSIV